MRIHYTTNDQEFSQLEVLSQKEVRPAARVSTPAHLAYAIQQAVAMSLDKSLSNQAKRAQFIVNLKSYPGTANLSDLAHFPEDFDFRSSGLEGRLSSCFVLSLADMQIQSTNEQESKPEPAAQHTAIVLKKIFARKQEAFNRLHINGDFQAYFNEMASYYFWKLQQPGGLNGSPLVIKYSANNLPYNAYAFQQANSESSQAEGVSAYNYLCGFDHKAFRSYVQAAHLIVLVGMIANYSFHYDGRDKGLKINEVLSTINSILLPLALIELFISFISSAREIYNEAPRIFAMMSEPALAYANMRELPSTLVGAPIVLINTYMNSLIPNYPSATEEKSSSTRPAINTSARILSTLAALPTLTVNANINTAALRQGFEQISNMYPFNLRKRPVANRTRAESNADEKSQQQPNLHAPTSASLSKTSN